MFAGRVPDLLFFTVERNQYVREGRLVYGSVPVRGAADPTGSWYYSTGIG